MQNLVRFLGLLICSFPWLIYSHPVQENVCTYEEFYCGRTRGGCIPIEWTCDNVQDCAYGQDEIGCSYLHVCSTGEFMCRSGECISQKLKCNGKAECEDGSDEAWCFGQGIRPSTSTSSTTVTEESLPESPAPNNAPKKQPSFGTDLDSDWSEIDFDKIVDKLSDSVDTYGPKIENAIKVWMEKEELASERLANFSNWVTHVFEHLSTSGVRIQGNFFLEIVSNNQENDKEKEKFLQLSKKST